MGCTREIDSRRERVSRQTADRHVCADQPASIGTVIRYLRQQNDVVVSQNDNVYLVNGRLRLLKRQLVERANCMRARQRKPPFVLIGNDPNLRNSSADNHPAVLT